MAAGELLARWWMRHRSLYCVFPPGGRLHLHIDREVFPELEPFVRFEVNREGERGEEVPRVGPGQRLYRILVAGGSQPEGYALDQATSWPGALQRVLQTPKHLRNLGAAHVHVGNISRSGVGSEALDLIFERVLPRYPRLDAVVILVGASDILRWLEQGAPPFPPSRSPTAEVFKCHPEGPFGWRPGGRPPASRPRGCRRGGPGRGRGRGNAGAGDEGARQGDPDRDARSRPHARSLRGSAPETPREGQGEGGPGAGRGTALVRQAVHGGRGGPHVARRGGPGVARGDHLLLLLRRRLAAHGPDEREGLPRGERTGRRAARPHADTGAQPRDVLRRVPRHAGGGQGRGGRGGGRHPPAAYPVDDVHRSNGWRRWSRHPGDGGPRPPCRRASRLPTGARGGGTGLFVTLARRSSRLSKAGGVDG